MLLITKMVKGKQNTYVSERLPVETGRRGDNNSRGEISQHHFSNFTSLNTCYHLQQLLSSLKAVSVSDSRQGPPFVDLITSQTPNHCFSNNLLFYKGLINFYGYIHVYLFQVVVRNSWYDLELVLFPTDVTNHYSGFPITRLTYSDLGHFQACSVLIHILDLPKWASKERPSISMITGVVLTFGPAMVVEAKIM